MQQDNDVRLADLAIASNQMRLDLHHLIWSVGYRDINNHPGAAAEMMDVSMLTAIATRRGEPMTASEIAKKLAMPYSNVTRHLMALERAGRVKRVKHRYIHDLDQLEARLKSRKVMYQALEIIERCCLEYKRLLPLLDDQLE